MEQLSELILEKLNTLVVVVNEQGTVDYVNSSAAGILGYAPEQLLGDAWWDLTRSTDEEKRKLKLLTQKIIRENNVEQLPYERLLKTAKGKDKWILWNTTKGPGNTMVGIGYDITDRKIAEQKLQATNHFLSQRNTDMLESIRYAQRIQQSILPDKIKIEQALNGGFVLYKPKDIVSGDFYWYYERNECIYIAAIDCTGHGVPGAFLSVLANSLLKKVVDNNVLEPAEILYRLDDELQNELNGSNEYSSADGMDIALCKIDKSKSRLSFAGAFRPLVLVRLGEVIEYRGSRNPIGLYGDTKKVFEQIEIELQQGDSLYLFSDGYVDQFGGEQSKKLNKSRFRELLLTMQTMDVKEQEAFLEYALNNWKQQEEQTDDILVIGLKV